MRSLRLLKIYVKKCWFYVFSPLITFLLGVAEFLICGEAEFLVLSLFLLIIMGVLMYMFEFSKPARELKRELEFWERKSDEWERIKKSLGGI